MKTFRLMGSLTVAAIATTCSLNLSARANTFNRLPQTLVGGSVVENIALAQLPTDISGNILERAAIDLDLSASLLEITAIQSIMWNNSCKGIYTSGMACTMALVPGWRALVTSGSQQWIYHSTERNAWQWNELSPLPDECWTASFLSRCANTLGTSQFNPILPTRSENNWFVFENAPDRRWSDPPTDYGFQYSMMGDSLFTQILDFPVGIDSDNLFQVLVGDRVLGEFQVGQEVDFLSLLGTGVSEFTIAGIQGAIDPDSPVAFPTRLAFDTPTASFKMRAISRPESIPEPQSAIAFFGVGLLGIWMRRDRAKKSFAQIAET